MGFIGLDLASDKVYRIDDVVIGKLAESGQGKETALEP